MLRYVVPLIQRTPRPSTVEPSPGPPATEINVGSEIYAITFSPNGDSLISGDAEGVRVWRVEDSKQVVVNKVGRVECLAVSRCGHRIAAGTEDGKVVVLDGETNGEPVFEHEHDFTVTGLDFSHDSDRLVSTTRNRTATVWDLANRKQAHLLNHEHWVTAAKYSPQGDRIATATRDSVRIWDSSDGRLLLDVKAGVTPWNNTGLLWSNNLVFVLCDNSIKQVDTSTGLVLSEWSVSKTNIYSRIVLARNGEFIAHSTNRTITFWDISTDARLAVTQHSQNIRCTAISPDNLFLVTGQSHGKIVFQNLPCITNVDNVTQHNNAPSLFTSPTPLFKWWIKATLANCSWRDTLIDAANSGLPSIAVYRLVCEHLESFGRITDAVECFCQMTGELGDGANLHDEHLNWAHDFRQRSHKKLKALGDTAVDAKQYDEALSYYTAALSINHPSQRDVDLLIKRSKAFVAIGSWKQALDDANQAILLDPLSPWGYEVKHAALHKAGDFGDAVDAFEEMLSKMMESPDPDVQRNGDRYISPTSTRATIRRIVQRTIRRLPRVLIDTVTGRLHDRVEQVSAFEALPIFGELVSSTTTRINYLRIKREVRQYFQYVTLSHKWEDNEPLYQRVMHTAVYDLGQSSTHNKLQTFCRIVRDGGFKWAWSDTCCINKSDHFVLQEALVAMFKWYEGSALTIVYLRGVRSSSRRGALVKSIWNTRAWTLQEYVASKVVHFYTEDWTLYLNLTSLNHKESPEVISEMEQATGVSAQQLMVLRPGLTSIREKLRLASTRETTLVEDVAYSLLGVFSASGVPAIYGEGEGSLGRLLANVLTRSGDASILAWTGESGQFNSCLPARIAVFNGPAISHLPMPVKNSEMEQMISRLQTPSFDLDMALRLYDRLNGLPTPRFAESRMTLPCIAFSLPRPLSRQTHSSHVYCVDTRAFGMVEIKTKYDLSRMMSLYLIHPWLDTLLEREDAQRSTIIADNATSSPLSPNTHDGEPSNEEPRDEDLSDEERTVDFCSLLDEDADDGTWSLAEPSMVSMCREKRALRLVARLGQPFGALLFTLTSTGRGGKVYRRVAADSVVSVRFREDVELGYVLANVRTLDVL